MNRDMEYARHSAPLEGQLEQAGLGHLVIGATLYLKDPRNTPIKVLSLEVQTATIVGCVADFEDVGAIWKLPFWDVSNFRVAPSAKEISCADQKKFGDRCTALNKTQQIAACAADREQTETEIARLEIKIRSWLGQHFADLPVLSGAMTDGVMPCVHWSAAFDAFIACADLADIDQAFAAQFASNPNASEMIKGHRIVLAQMGLVGYNGHIVRDPQTFQGAWSRERRRAHIVTRLAFMRVQASMLGLVELAVFRTIYSDGRLSAPRNTGFVSATFSAVVAAALFRSGQKTRCATLSWQQVPTGRLFMSYFETPALSARFQEAEAVLLFDPSNSIF